MIRTSHDSASSQPPPIADPFIAATKTAPLRLIASSIAWKRSICTTPASGVRASALSARGTRRTAATVRSDPAAARGPTAGLFRAPARSSATS